MAHLSFRVVNDRDGQLAKLYPFWIGTAVGMVFVILAFVVALADISFAKRQHAQSLALLNAQEEAQYSVVPGSGKNVAVRMLFDAPDADATLSGKTDVRLSVQPEGAKSSLVRLFIDGADAAVFTEGPYIYVWDTKNVSNGSHMLTTMAVDGNGAATVMQRKVMVQN